MPDLAYSLVRLQAREIAAAQKEKEYHIEGKKYKRIAHQGQKHCSKCSVAPAQLHVPGCELERCPCCNDLAATCSCAYLLPVSETDDDEE